MSNAEKDMELRSRSTQQRTSPSNGIAAVLSLVIPGAGQMYKGSVLGGLLWLAFVTLGYLCLIFPGILLHLTCIFSAASGQKESAVVIDQVPVVRKDVGSKSPDPSLMALIKNVCLASVLILAAGLSKKLFDLFDDNFSGGRSPTRSALSDPLPLCKTTAKWGAIAIVSCPTSSTPREIARFLRAKENELALNGKVLIAHVFTEGAKIPSSQRALDSMSDKKMNAIRLAQFTTNMNDKGRDQFYCVRQAGKKMEDCIDVLKDVSGH